jgi:hypothetical protein
LIGVLCGAGFRRALVRSEGVVPEAVEVRSQRLYASRIELVEPTVAVGSVDHQVGVLENAEVLRNRGAADREAPSQFAHRLRSLQEPFEDRSSGRISQSIELTVVMVSNH